MRAMEALEIGKKWIEMYADENRCALV